MCELKKFSKMTEDAKERFKNDKQILKVIEDMEKDISEKARINGTLLTLELCEDKREKFN